jgi:hypothetical protein
MDPAVLSATSGLVGSVVGGVSTFAASWLTSRKQYRVQTLVQQAVRREALYTEFVAEATRRLADAWSHEAGGPEVIAGLWAGVARMRLISSRAVVDAAEALVRNVIEAYAAPNHTFNDLRERARAQARDPLREFSEACRAELLAAGGSSVESQLGQPNTILRGAHRAAEQ